MYKIIVMKKIAQAFQAILGAEKPGLHLYSAGTGKFPETVFLSV
ncbi:hypothetical protein [Cesiribacter sp. SM1]|nr:hypothetical protein [Cesiribacter sp. SM1]